MATETWRTEHILEKDRQAFRKQRYTAALRPGGRGRIGKVGGVRVRDARADYMSLQTAPESAPRAPVSLSDASRPALGQNHKSLLHKHK